MLDALRKLMLSLNAHAQAHKTSADARRLAVLTIKSGAKLDERIDGLAEMAARHAAETASWVDADALAQGKGGRFDACDLRHWLALAARAGVPAIPAREILSLTEDEMALASGTVQLSPTLSKRLASTMSGWMARHGIDAQKDTPVPDREAVQEKLAAAMDDVPSGWMVRHVRCGPSSLKALAGCGASGPEAPETRFDAELEVGPGWVRNGNRRRVDAGDARFVESYAQGPNGPSVFVARPWVKAARWAVGEDPHRHGTRFAGKGMWPAEWRAFVEGGRVIGVSSYYAWCGSATPENARMALVVRALAQKIVDEAKSQNAIPAFMDVEFMRDSKHFADIPARFPRDQIACTLDFIETASGVLFLEGGPAFTRVGGGHPCGFAGLERPEGVAFRIMPDVLLGDPRTWKETDRTGCILAWDAVEHLAA